MLHLVWGMHSAKGDVHSPQGAHVIWVEAALESSSACLRGWAMTAGMSHNGLSLWLMISDSKLVANRKDSANS